MRCTVGLGFVVLLASLLPAIQADDAKKSRRCRRQDAWKKTRHHPKFRLKASPSPMQQGRQDGTSWSATFGMRPPTGKCTKFAG